MANETGNFGLRAARQLDGSPYNGAQNRYRILKNYGTALYQGDLVMTSVNGTIERAGATSNPVVGVFNGVFYTDPTTSNRRGKIIILQLFLLMTSWLKLSMVQM